MGGNVELVRSKRGAGSCFRLTLPLVAARQSKPVDDAAFHKPVQRAKKPNRVVHIKGHVLLAEDGPDNQRLIAYHLRKAGAEVEIADNGRHALRLYTDREAQGGHFDILLTDLQMPEMDGHTLTRELRASGCAIPIIALTAHAFTEHQERCISAGCDAFVTKPIDRQELIETCAHWIGRRSESASVLAGSR